MKIDTILVPTDFSDDATHALEIAAEFARTFSARIVLLHAYSIDMPLAGAAYGGGVILPDGFYVQYRDQAMQHVENVAKETASKEGVEVTGVAIQQPAWIAVIEESEKLGADLIVMGTRRLVLR